jgi:hypothetical protein
LVGHVLNAIETALLVLEARIHLNEDVLGYGLVGVVLDGELLARVNMVLVDQFHALHLSHVDLLLRIVLLLVHLHAKLTLAPHILCMVMGVVA